MITTVVKTGLLNALVRVCVVNGAYNSTVGNMQCNVLAQNDREIRPRYEFYTTVTPLPETVKGSLEGVKTRRCTNAFVSYGDLDVNVLLYACRRFEARRLSLGTRDSKALTATLIDGRRDSIAINDSDESDGLKTFLAVLPDVNAPATLVTSEGYRAAAMRRYNFYYETDNAVGHRMKNRQYKLTVTYCDCDGRLLTLSAVSVNMNDTMRATLVNHRNSILNNSAHVPLPRSDVLFSYERLKQRYRLHAKYSDYNKPCNMTLLNDTRLVINSNDAVVSGL